METIEKLFSITWHPSRDKYDRYTGCIKAISAIYRLIEGNAMRESDKLVVEEMTRSANWSVFSNTHVEVKRIL